MVTHGQNQILTRTRVNNFSNGYSLPIVKLFVLVCVKLKALLCHRGNSLLVSEDVPVLSAHRVSCVHRF